jgi:hypothetical protein
MIERERGKISSPLFLENAQCTENVIDHQYHNDGDTPIPEETHDEVKEAHNDVKEVAQDDEQDHQEGSDPDPCADV